MADPRLRMNPPLDLIIDCDPGIDDALALFLAAGSPDQLRLLAVTCVAGNRPVEITAGNACRLLDAAGCPHIPVFAGAAMPLAGTPPRCNLVHGADGLGGIELPSRRGPEAEQAVDYLLRVLHDAPLHSITLVAIGPLTNLALAEIRRPGVLRRTREVLVMGGAVARPGNITPSAEFNFYADPHAAQVVLEAGVGLKLFGLDVTSKAVMSDPWIDSLRTIDTRCASLSHAMLKAYAALDPLLHDACPIGYLLQPDLFEGAPWSLRVTCEPGPHEGQVIGQCVDPLAEPTAAPSVQVYFEVQHERLLWLVSSRLARLP